MGKLPEQGPGVLPQPATLLHNKGDKAVPVLHGEGGGLILLKLTKLGLGSSPARDGIVGEDSVVEDPRNTDVDDQVNTIGGV